MYPKLCSKSWVGKELKKKIENREPLERIGAWMYEIHLDCGREFGEQLQSLFLDLAMMELGEGFFKTYEELDQIADELIAGKEPHLK